MQSSKNRIRIPSEKQCINTRYIPLFALIYSIRTVLMGNFQPVKEIETRERYIWQRGVRFQLARSRRRTVTQKTLIGLWYMNIVFIKLQISLKWEKLTLPVNSPAASFNPYHFRLFTFHYSNGKLNVTTKKLKLDLLNRE